jgi:hypothetical protein
MEYHILELSDSLSPEFVLGNFVSAPSASIMQLEMAMLCGCLVHPMSSFMLGCDGKSLRMEWVQEYPV